jgi:hypothetical protein
VTEIKSNGRTIIEWHRPLNKDFIRNRFLTEFQFCDIRQSEEGDFLEAFALSLPGDSECRMEYTPSSFVATGRHDAVIRRKSGSVPALPTAQSRIVRETGVKPEIMQWDGEV